MGVEIPIGYGQATFIFAVAGKPGEMVTTLGYDAPTDFGPSVAAAAIRTIWSNSGAPFAAANVLDNCTFRGVKTTEMTATGPIVGQSLVNVVGTLSGSGLPPNCAFLVRKGTDRGGRQGRGRMFIPPVVYGESGVDSAGSIIGLFVSQFDAKLLQALTAQNASDYPAMLFHESGSTPDLVTSLSTQNMIATQRRRLR